MVVFAANSNQSNSAASASSVLPSGRRIGFWVADDDIFTTGSPYGLSPLPWTPQQFFDNYFNTPPYPATMLWVSGLISSGAASVPSDQEAQWLSQVATLADSHPNIKILMLFFVNLSGNSIETFIAAHSACFSVKRQSPLTLFGVCGLTPSAQYTISLEDSNHALVTNIGSFTTNSTGGFSGTFAIPNEPQTNNLWYIVVDGTPLYSEVALQSDQTLQLTSYMNIIKGHSSIYGALFEPEYFGDNAAIEATFGTVITGAGYQDLVGLAGLGNPVLAYSSYPYFGGALQTSPGTNQVGVHYGETGGPLCSAQNPCPIWTQTTVLNIVDNSAPLPCTIIISENDNSNPAGNSYLWASPTLRNWIQNDPYYQANYIKSNGAVLSTTSGQSSTLSATTITSTIPPASGIDISFSSYSTPFAYGQNFMTPGNSFPIQVTRPVEINMIAFYLSDRAYDPNPISFNLVDQNGNTLATGLFPGTPMFASQQYYPVQLSQLVTLQPGVNYQVKFGPLPSGDQYGVSQDIIQEAAPPGAGYLGQSQWPLFQLGLMNVLTENQGLAYHNYGAYTDLFSSPGYQSTGEIAMRFQASQSEQLLNFEVNIWKSDTSSNKLVFTLRPDVGGHPGPASSALASASLTANQIQANLTGGNNFAKVVFPTRPSLSAGTYYWIVAAAPANVQDVQFGRLVSPYREYVLYSTNDFQTSGVPPDGPTDLGFRITTTGESIVNTVSGSSGNSYFTGIAQSLIPTASTSVKGAWLSAKPFGQDMIVSIQSDNGADGPSGTILAQGTSSISTQFAGGTQPFVYVGFTSYATLNPGTKYWLVATIGPCLASSCSSPTVAATLQFRSDYSTSGFAPSGGAHYDLLQGSTWVSIADGMMTFELVAPTGHESDSIWGSQTTTITSTLQSTTSTTSSTTTSTTTSTTSFLSSSSSSSSSSYSSPSTTSTTSSPATSSTNTFISETSNSDSTTPGPNLTTSTTSTAGGSNGFVLNNGYGVSIDSTRGSVLPGGSVATIIKVSPDSLSPTRVQLYASATLGAISVSLQPDSGTAPFSTLLSIQVSPNAPSGNYSIVIRTVSSAGNGSIDYTLNVVRPLSVLHSVTIVVRDIYGMPISGADVSLRLLGWSTSARTSGNGTVVFGGVPSGTFNSTISYLGASSLVSGNTLTNPEINVTVVLSPPVAVSLALIILVPVAIILIRRFRSIEIPEFSWAVKEDS